MPLSFLLALTTYAVFISACIASATQVAGGIVNTATLGIFLFSLLRACQGVGNKHHGFWVGFCLFFASMFALHAARYGFDIIGSTLATPLGQMIYALMNGRTIHWYEFNEVAWYEYVATCYVAIAFGLVGGLFAGRIFRPNDQQK